jgi:protein-tyrosine phosphatase
VNRLLRDALSGSRKKGFFSLNLLIERLAMPEFVDRHPCPQRLPLSGAVNFRDLGGYRTVNDRQVKQRLVFRSDHLSRLTAEDQQLLQHLRFKVVCDLRTAQEQQRHPDLLPRDGSIRLLLLPIQAGNFDPALVMDRLRAGERDWLSLDFFVNLYRQYLDDFGPVWGKILRLIAAPANLPLVFHCTGGKDRTGICATLLLLTLGVQEKDIFLDHDRSNACNAERLQSIYARFADLGIEPEQAAPYLQAPREPLAAMLEHLRKSYGTIDNYLETKAGLDETTLAALRSNLLE